MMTITTRTRKEQHSTNKRRYHKYTVIVLMASLDEKITALKASTPHPPCKLTTQQVLNWRENGLVPVVGGLCKNLKMVDGKLVECGWPVGEHPSETAEGTATTAPFTISHIIEVFHSYLTKLTSTQLLLLF
jgi:hypothetical protein